MARLFAYDAYSRPVSQYSGQQDFRSSASYHNSRPPAWTSPSSYKRYPSHYYPSTSLAGAGPAFKYSTESRPFSHHAPDPISQKDEPQRPYSSDYLRRYLDIVSRPVARPVEPMPPQGRPLRLGIPEDDSLVYELQRRLAIVKSQQEISEAYCRSVEESGDKEQPSELTTTVSKSWLRDGGVDANTQTSAHADRRVPTPRESCSRVQESKPRRSWMMIEPVTCSSSNNEVGEDPKNMSLQEGLIFCQPAVLNSRVRSPKPTVVVPHPSYAKMVNKYRVRSQTQPRQTRNPLCHVSLTSNKAAAEPLPARQRKKKRTRGSKELSGSDSGSKTRSKRSEKPVGATTLFTNMSPWDTRSDDDDGGGGAAAVKKCSSDVGKRHPKRRRSRVKTGRASKSSSPRWKTTKLKASSAKSGRRYSDVLWDTRWVTDSQVNATGRSKHEDGRSVTRSTSTPRFRINMDYVSVDTRVISGKGTESPRQRMKNIACSMALPGPPGAHGDLRFPLIHTPTPSNSGAQRGKLTAKYSTLVEAVKIVEKRRVKKKFQTVKSKESLTAVVTKNCSHGDEQVPTLVSEGPRPLPVKTKDESHGTSVTVSDTECHGTAEKGTGTYDPVELLKRFKEYISTTRGKGRLRTSNIQVKAYPSADVIARAFNALPKTSQQIGVQPLVSDVLTEREINTDSSYVNVRKAGGLRARRYRKKTTSPRRAASRETSRAKGGKTSKHKKDIRDSPAVSRKRRTK